MVRKSTKTKKKNPVRRKMTKKTTPRKKATAQKTVTQEMRQLSVYHDPFSRATKQPKIPDGKVTESLGFQTQAVGEMISNQNIVHCLLYGGIDAGLMFLGDTVSAAAYTGSQSHVVGFTGSNGVDWASVGIGGGVIDMLDDYSQWRLVSQGLKLALLNPVEQDDGWWEAVRVTEPLATIDYILHTKDSSKDEGILGTVAPQGLLDRFANKNLVNERSYATGLLRDIHKHAFNLHPQKDEHDFSQQTDKYTLEASDVTVVNATDVVASLGIGRKNVQGLIEQVIDTSHDFLYIRIHGRTDNASRSRLHYNVVANQEIQFGIDEKESRYHTRSSNIGGAMDSHTTAKRGTNTAADVVMS